VINARDYYQQERSAFEQVLQRGFQERFDWRHIAMEYIQKLYEPVMA